MVVHPELPRVARHVVHQLASGARLARLARCRRVGVLGVMALAIWPAACGESSERAGGNGIDRTFAVEMISHHRSAIEMADLAEERSRRKKIKDLAGTIVETQSSEITTLEGLSERFEQAGVDRGDLGMRVDEMGMHMDAGMLEDARPFDREFIDMMIAHHQGAIRMARVQLAKGESSELKRLSRSVIDAQAREIDRMNLWRVDWYGALSPAGGVPAEGDPAAPAEGEGGHHSG